MILILWLLLEITMLLDVCCKKYVIVFVKFFFLPKTSIRAWVLGKQVTVVQVTAFKFLYALFFKAMSKE